MFISRSLLVVAVTVLVLSAAAHADDAKKRAAPACPSVVTNAIHKAFPNAAVSTCKAEREHGQDQFEVKLTKADGSKAEVDVSTDGKILQTEEKIAVDQVPAAVSKAFSAKYTKAKIDGAEKQTPAKGAATYELTFATDKGRKEATFREDGTFVEEE